MAQVSPPFVRLNVDHDLFRFGREIEEDSDNVKISQQWTDDDIVIHLR